MNPIWTDIRKLLRGAMAAARARPAIFFVAIPAAMVLAVAIFFPRDVAISDWIYRDRPEPMREFARRYSAFGDFRLTLELFAAFWLLGAWKNRADWKRLGIAVLLAASLAGATDTTIRTLTGRPRPSANKPDHFTGPQFRDHKMQSFPSAHAATSMATASVIAIALPEVGIPFFVFSLGVPWARFYMHDHYLSDITVGGLIGIWFGAALGIAHRKFQ